MSDWLTKQMEDEKKLRAAFQKAASALCQPHEVKIRWQSPAGAGECGSVSKTQGGKFIVDISPNIGLDAQYKTFLHELGHVLGGAATIKPSNYYMEKPRSRGMVWKALEARRADPSRKRREERANSIAAQLEDFANSKASAYCNYREPVIFARLKALAAGGPVQVVDHTKGVRP